MPLDRRNFMGAAGAFGTALLLSGGPAIAASGTRVFHLYRGDRRIGEQSLTVMRDGEDVGVAVDIDIAVRILGLPAYSYRLQSDETWRNGRLKTLTARTDDNGTAHSVDALREGDALRIEGSGFSGTVTGNPATTTYWNPDFLERSMWISTQDGTPLSVQVSRGDSVTVPAEDGSVTATRWLVRGDIGTLDLFFDAQGEWIGNEFVARGERARMVVAERGGNLTPLWPSA